MRRPVLKSVCAALAAALIMLFMLSPGPAQAREYDLERVAPETRAIGRATLTPGFRRSDRRELFLVVFHLKPDSVYSVWIMDKRSGRRIPAGLTGKNHFRTDGSGNGHYTHEADWLDFGWNTLEVAYHPDGEPSNTDEMIVVLRTGLYP